MPSSVNLDDVAAGIGGFKILGEVPRDYAGRSVSGAGDVNGDGFADLLVGASGNDAGGRNAGAAYVVFGKASGAAVDLATVAAGRGGFKIVGENPGDYAARSVAAGDVNGDGFPDLVVGAFNDAGGMNAGAAYVVFGKAGGFTTVDLDDVAAGMSGFKITGELLGDYAGVSVSAAGDVNDDGFADLLVGATGNDEGGRNAGAAYVVFGKAGGAAVDLADVAAGAGGFKIVGEDPRDDAAESVAAGDVNGDGFPDLVVGASRNDVGGIEAGAAYVVFGRARGFTTVDLDDVAAGVGGFKIVGENPTDSLGSSVSVAGDVNGDGLNDLLIAAVGNAAGGINAGAAYLVFGKASGFTTIDLAEIAAGAGGFKIIGEFDFDEAGASVAGAGDVNGDGFDDLIVGAPGNEGGGYDGGFNAGSGAAYVVLGKPGGFTTVDLDAVAAGTGGFKIIGETVRDYAGASVSGAGDVNGDGFDDLLVGATSNDEGGFIAGAAYVVFGFELDASATPTGTEGDDTLFGTPQDDRIEALGGDDMVHADEGDDTVAGGAGRDRLLGEGGDDRLDGGAESDSLAGGQGDDTVDGGLGRDSLAGGRGDDELTGGAAADWTSHAEDPAGATVDLAAGTATDGWGGTDTLSGIEHVIGSQFADRLTGDGGGNVLRGLGRADRLSGDAGDDRLLGGDGADVLAGGAGDDVLAGGGGVDRLLGGPGRDRLAGGGAGDKFVFANPAETGFGAGLRDTILDFSQAQGDRIALQAIDADATLAGNQAFSFIGDNAFTGAGQLRVVQSGSRTLVQGNVDGDLAAEFQIQLVGLHSLTAGDFGL